MRIQVLPLPAISVGVFTENPFVLVVDDYDGAHPDEFRALKEATGALSVLMSEAVIDVGSPLILTDEQAEQIRARFEGALTT